MAAAAEAGVAVAVAAAAVPEADSGGREHQGPQVISSPWRSTKRPMIDRGTARTLQPQKLRSVVTVRDDTQRFYSQRRLHIVHRIQPLYNTVSDNQTANGFCILGEIISVHAL